MPILSQNSKKILSKCDPKIQKICNEIIKYYDFTILEGYRNKERQNNLFLQKKSLLKYPKSMHNQMPSKAIDICPYPINWNDINRFYFLAGLFLSTANMLNTNIIWGGDWDQDNIYNDQIFNDLCHFELAE